MSPVLAVAQLTGAHAAAFADVVAQAGTLAAYIAGELPRAGGEQKQVAGRLDCRVGSTSAAEKSAFNVNSSTNGAKAGRGVISVICVLCFCAIGVNLIKDGLSGWNATIFKECFDFGDNFAQITTIVLPVVGFIGQGINVKLQWLIL